MIYLDHAATSPLPFDAVLSVSILRNFYRDLLMCQVARRAGFFPLAPHSVAPREIEASLTTEITFLSGFPDSRHTLPAHRAGKLHIYRH